MKKRGGVRSREDTCGGYDGLIVQICISKIISGRKNKIGSLASNIGIFDDGFEEILAAGKESKIESRYEKLRLCVQTHRDNSITWIDFDKASALVQ